MWPHLANAVLAAWVTAAPATLADGGLLRTQDRIAGPIAAASALIAAWAPTRGVRYIDIAVGGWLVIAPWLLGATAAPTARSMAAGIVMIVLAAVGRHVDGEFGGGWAALWRRDR